MTTVTTAEANQRGFTLVELVVGIVIVSVLAVVALPRFISMSRDARIASLTALAGVLQSTANNVRVACRLNPDCDYSNPGQTLSIGGKLATVNYGWLDSGDQLNGSQIDTWVDYSGFTATLPWPANTRFTLDGAPDPVNCSVDYVDAYSRGAAQGIMVAVNTSGC